MMLILLFPLDIMISSEYIKCFGQLYYTKKWCIIKQDFWMR